MRSFYMSVSDMEQRGGKSGTLGGVGAEEIVELGWK